MVVFEELQKCLQMLPKGIVKIILVQCNDKPPWALKIDILKSNKYKMYDGYSLTQQWINKPYLERPIIRLDDFCDEWKTRYEYLPDNAYKVTQSREFKQISRLYNDFFYEWLFLPSLTNNKEIQLAEFINILFYSIFNINQTIYLGDGLRAFTLLFLMVRNRVTLPLLLENLHEHVSLIEKKIKLGHVPPSSFMYPTLCLLKLLKFYDVTRSTDFDYYQELCKSNIDLINHSRFSRLNISVQCSDKAFNRLFKLCGIIE